MKKQLVWSIRKVFNFFMKKIQIFISKATSNLAYCFENGVGSQQDLQKAMEFYDKAGKLGYLPGNYIYIYFFKEEPNHLVFS